MQIGSLAADYTVQGGSKMRRVMSFFMLLCISSAVFASGSKDAGTQTSGGKPTELTMYLLGEPPAGFESVEAEVNKKLAADLNAKVKFNFLSWGDWDTRYPLILNSGEAFDIIYTANWCFFGEFKQKGGYLALNDLIAKNAPKIAKSLNKDAIDQSSYKGNQYMVPAMSTDLNDNGYLIRGDLRKKYGTPAIKTVADLELYLDAIKKNEPQMIPFNAGFNDTGLLNSMVMFENDWMPDNFMGSVFYSLKDPKKTFSWYLTPEFEAFAKRMRTWNDKGFWSKNVLSNEGIARDSFQLGTGGMAIVNIMELNDVYRRVKSENPSWELEWYVMGPDTTMTKTTYDGNGYAIGAKSKNPELSLKVLEKFIQDESYNDLLFYGIKGVNYNLDSEKRLIKGSGDFYSGEDVSIWGLKNALFKKYAPDLFPNFISTLDSLMKKAVTSPYALFTFDRTPVEAELAAISNVEDQYAKPVTWGLVDPTEGLKSLKDQLKIAGIDKVQAEFAKQSAAYLSSK